MDHTRLQRNLTLPNDVNTIPQLNEFLDSFFDEVGIGMEMTMSLNLALEEAVVNVMDYAYPKGTNGTVHIDAMAANGKMSFVITDHGTPFDPTAAKEIDTTLPVEERAIGGLGIHLIRHIMDDIQYERTDNCNVLKLTKNIKSESIN